MFKFFKIPFILTLMIIILSSCGSTKHIETIDIVDKPRTQLSQTQQTPLDEPLKMVKVEVDSFTTTQQNLINRSESIEKKSVHLLRLDDDGIEVNIIFIGDETLVLMTLDDISTMNNTLRMVEILEELVDKYSIENGFNLSVFDSLNKELTLLNERVSILNGDLKNKDKIISTLKEVIVELKESNSKLKEAHLEQKELLNIKDNEIKKQKRQKWFIAIGSGIITILALVIGS